MQIWLNYPLLEFCPVKIFILWQKLAYYRERFFKFVKLPIRSSRLAILVMAFIQYLLLFCTQILSVEINSSVPLFLI